MNIPILSCRRCCVGGCRGPHCSPPPARRAGWPCGRQGNAHAHQSPPSLTTCPRSAHATVPLPSRTHSRHPILTLPLLPLHWTPSARPLPLPPPHRCRSDNWSHILLPPCFTGTGCRSSSSSAASARTSTANKRPRRACVLAATPSSSTRSRACDSSCRTGTQE